MTITTNQQYFCKLHSKQPQTIQKPQSKTTTQQKTIRKPCPFHPFASNFLPACCRDHEVPWPPRHLEISELSETQGGDTPWHPFISHLNGCQPKNRGILPPKMDGLFHGKPYEQMDDLGGFYHPYFLETSKSNLIVLKHIFQSFWVIPLVPMDCGDVNMQIWKPYMLQES